MQLVARYWRIVDENGHTEEVRGPGVVGEQPVLGPDDSYQYVSGCPLMTRSGTMAGFHEMLDGGKSVQSDYSGVFARYAGREAGLELVEAVQASCFRNSAGENT